ncbi:hypothetical protein I4U23_018828 [Adineta vaga]|nr:hypothetical protein I4U23_018828 [Adineta vaga]
MESDSKGHNESSNDYDLYSFNKSQPNKLWTNSLASSLTLFVRKDLYNLYSITIPKQDDDDEVPSETTEATVDEPRVESNEQDADKEPNNDATKVANGHVIELHLEYLNERLRDFRHCSRKYFNLKHVHLLLSGRYDNPKRYFNIHRLHELVPHLHLLETSDSVIMRNEDLVEVILKISHQFNQLVQDKLIAFTHDQQFHGYKFHFQFHVDDELRI